MFSLEGAIGASSPPSRQQPHVMRLSHSDLPAGMVGVAKYWVRPLRAGVDYQGTTVSRRKPRVIRKQRTKPPRANREPCTRGGTLAPEGRGGGDD